MHTFNLLMVAFSVAPADWEPFVRNRKMSLLELKDTDYDRIIQRIGFEEVRRTDRQLSLPDKAERLLQLTKPDPNWDISFKYNGAELREIDELRHEIIHSKYGVGNLLTISDMDQKLAFLEQTAMYLFTVVKSAILGMTWI